MSWGINITGTKLGVAKEVASECDRIAASYAGKPEADDILACKARALALIDALDFSKSGGYEPNAVKVEAGGSHSTGPAGLYAGNFRVSVERVRLALDPA